MRQRKPTRYTCERCGADAGPSGVHCGACARAIVADLAASPAWMEVRYPHVGADLKRAIDEARKDNR